MQTLATDDIAKSYRGRRVVNGVSIHVNQAEVVGLLGTSSYIPVLRKKWC